MKGLVLTLRQVRRAAVKRILFLPHAIMQMSDYDRQITAEDVRRVLLFGEVIEDYSQDPRGHTCLLFGLGEKRRPIHVVCAPKTDYVAVVTAYVPDHEEWEDDFRIRRQP